MCGIAGWIGSNIINSTEQKNIFESCVQKLAPRGPEFQNVISQQGYMLGHARLSIIDLSAASNQPLTDGNGNYIVFNGEIYNYKELKSDLQKKGVSFFSNGDSEVLLKGLVNEGFGFIEKLRGMFAFAYLNTSKMQLTLCRDRVGVKPLAYAINNGNISFASDLFALKQLQNNLEIDEDSASMFLMLGYIPAPNSIYKSIKKIEPATYIQFHLNSNFSIASQTTHLYWNVAQFASNFNTNNTTVADEYEHLVTQSVQYRLVSDVEVGSLLSGGIDSTLVTLKAAQLTNNNITCFTTGFDDKHYNEMPYATAIAQHLNLKHAKDYLTEQNVLEVWKNMWQVYDEPFADSSALPMISLCKSVKKHFKVALSGDGGDEANAGYPWHKALFKIHKLPFTIPSYAAKTLSSLASNPQVKYKIQALGINDKIDQWIFLKTGLTKSQFSFLPFNNVNGYNLLRNYFEHHANKLTTVNNILNWGMCLDILTYLQDDLLVKADRASMSVGLELREPLLDHSLIEFCLSTPIEQRVNLKTFQSKQLSRKIVYKNIPQNLIDRPKQGFSPPLNKWLKNALLQNVQDATNNLATNKLHPYTKPKNYANWAGYAQTIQDNHHQYLWRLVCFNTWNN